MPPCHTIARAVILILAATRGLPAQVTLRTTGRELRDALGDVVHIWASPLHAEQRDWVATLGVAAATAALVPVDDQIDSWIVRHPNAVAVDATRPWRESNPTLGDLSTGRRLFPISAALIAAGMLSDNRKLREAGWGCLSAWQGSSTVRHALYAGVARERPSVENADPYAIDVPGGEWDVHSFFAGHAANAAACVTFWNARFHMGVIEPVLYAGALGISLSRMADRRHWASDTWVGLAVGYAMGRSVAARYARREARREQREREPVRASSFQRLGANPAQGFGIAPMPGGVAVRWQGSFR